MRNKYSLATVNGDSLDTNRIQKALENSQSAIKHTNFHYVI